MKSSKKIPILVYIIILVLGFSLLLNIIVDGTDELTYSQVVELFQNEQVQKFIVKDDKIYLELNKPYLEETEFTAPLADADRFRQEMWDLIQEQSKAGTM